MRDGHHPDIIIGHRALVMSGFRIQQNRPQRMLATVLRLGLRSFRFRIQRAHIAFSVLADLGLLEKNGPCQELMRRTLTFQSAWGSAKVLTPRGF